MSNLTIWDGEDHRGNQWIITRYSEAMPQLVHWRKWGTRGKLLDQVSRWNGDHWCGGRWWPSKAVVPDAIRLEVEASLRGE